MQLVVHVVVVVAIRYFITFAITSSQRVTIQQKQEQTVDNNMLPQPLHYAQT